MYGYIYITTPKSDHWYYIGKRAKSEFDTNYVGSGNVIKKYLQTHSKNDLTCTPIEWCETLEELNEAEKKWIKLYKEKNIEKCRNIAEGGDGGICWDKHPTRGKIQIHKNDEIKYVSEEELPEYLAQNWIQGPTGKFCNKQREFMLEKIGVNKDGEIKLINKNELPEYLIQGYNEGYGNEFGDKISKARQNKNFKGKHWVHNGDIETVVSDEELPIFLDNGWIKGRSDIMKIHESDSQKGKTQSLESNKKRSETLKGRKKSEEWKIKIGAANKKPKKKFYWQTPSGEIKIMNSGNAKRCHPDWVCLGPVE